MTAATTTAPERIWAWDDSGKLGRDKSWAACFAGDRSTEYVRSDLCRAPVWRDIATAPRDGTAILASGVDHGKGPSRHYSVVVWMDFGCETGWYPDEDSAPHIYLTHWQPLPPAPPATEGEA